VNRSAIHGGWVGGFLTLTVVLSSCTNDSPTGPKAENLSGSTGGTEPTVVQGPSSSLNGLNKWEVRHPWAAVIPPELQLPPFELVVFRAFASGVQIYSCDGTTWILQGPEATLYDDQDKHLSVGKYYAGPTWESRGVKVGGVELSGVIVNPTAIPSLLLKAVSISGSGVLANVTYIQQLNTTGGLAPANPGTPGEVAHVPFTAEFLFYAAEGGSTMPIDPGHFIQITR